MGTLFKATDSARRLIAEETKQRVAVETSRRDADSATTAARAAVRSAEAALASAQQLSRQGQRALHTARDAVSVLDPPRADDADVGTAWDQLTTWAGAQRDSLTSQIELRTPQAVAARTAATVTTNQAETELRFARARKAELTEVLTDGPAADTAVAELDQVKTLERQRGEVDKRLLEARAATEARARAMTIEAEE